MHARLNNVRQIELRSEPVWHGTEHASDAYSTVYQRIYDTILFYKNHTKSKLDCNIMGYIHQL